MCSSIVVKIGESPNVSIARAMMDDVYWKINDFVNVNK